MDGLQKICDACDPSNAMLYLIHGEQHSQDLKNLKNQNLGKKRKRDTKDLTVQGSRADKNKSLKKNKVKGVPKKKLIDTQFESNINTVAEELVSSENAKSR